MIIISARRDFINPNKLLPETEPDQFKIVNLPQSEIPNSGLSKSNFLQKLSKLSDKRILMLVHGYNNEHDKMCRAYYAIEKNVAKYIKNQYGIVIGYSWPGGEHRLAWWLAKCNADKTAKRLKILIKDILREPSSNIQLDVISHSLGARVILEMLKQLSKENLGWQPVRNYFCMAAAVDNEVLEPNEKFYASTSQVNNIYIFHSKHDQALRSAYKLSKFDRALGVYGPEHFNKLGKHIYVVNCENHVESHGAYKGTASVYKYIQTVLTNKQSINGTTTL